MRFNSLFVKPSNKAALVLVASSLQKKAQQSYPVPFNGHKVSPVEEKAYQESCSFASSLLTRAQQLR